MKVTLIFVSLAVIGALAVGVTAGDAVGTARRKVICTIQNTDQSPVGKLTGYELGFINCPAPGGGKGLHFDTFVDSIAPPNRVDVRGRWKEYFDLGTTHGTYSASGRLMGTNATLTGSVKVLGGTGAYRHAKGSGTLTCKSHDAGGHTRCTVVLKETGI